MSHLKKSGVLSFFFFNTTKPFYLETTKSKTPNAIVGKENSLQVIVQTTSKLPAMEERRSVTPVIEHKRDFGTTLESEA